MPKAAHPTYTLPSNASCKHPPDPVPPQPHRLVTDVDPTYEQQIFNAAQRLRGPNAHLNQLADRFGLQNSFFLTAGCGLYVLWYGIWGCKTKAVV